MKKTEVNNTLGLEASQRNTVLMLKASILVFAAVAMFFQDLALIFTDALQNETTSHILVVPFLLTYFIYRKRRIIKASISFEFSPSPKNILLRKEIVSALLFLIAFLVYSYGSYTFTPLEYHVFARL